MDSVYVINIERSVLSCILFDNSEFEKINEVLNADDFYLPAHQKIYEAMVNLENEEMPIDEEFIRKRVNTKDADDSILIEIMTANAITNTKAYIEEIKEGSKLRKLANIATLIKKGAIEEENKSEVIISDIRKELDILENDSSVIEDFNGQELLNMSFPKVPLYMTGIDGIDRELDGIANGQLIYVIGLEETGKTHITYKIMENLSVSRKVGIISLEFGKEKLKDRLSGMIKNGHEINPSNIKASFTCHDINRLEKTIRNWHEKGVNFFVIDSINLIENHQIKDRFERILNIGTRIFKLMQQLNITIFVISTSTKEDNKNGTPSIYGGQLLNNYCDGKWLIMRNFETEERLLWVNKNKQNFKYPKIPLFFDREGGISEIKIEIEKPRRNFSRNSDPIETTEFNDVEIPIAI